MKDQCNVSGCVIQIGPIDIICEKHFRVMSNRMQDWLNKRLEENSGRFFPRRLANT